MKVTTENNLWERTLKIRKTEYETENQKIRDSSSSQLEKAMAPHSSTFAWKIPWMEEPARLQSMGSRESDTTEQLHFHFSLSRIGEGNGNPLQCSCLENPRDREAWWASVYGVAQSRTRLKQLSSSSSQLLVYMIFTSQCTSMLIHVQLFVTLWTLAHQVPVSMEFSRQGYWRGLLCPSPRNFPYPRIEPMSPVVAVSFFTTWATSEAHSLHKTYVKWMQSPIYNKVKMYTLNLKLVSGK